MNGYLWRILFVDPDDPMLVDRSGYHNIATTDPINRAIYLDSSLSGNLLVKVLIHELGHCALVSFDLLDEIHQMVKPEYWVEAEEWICNFLVDYGFKIFSTFYSIYGFDSWKMIPYELNRGLVA